MEISKVNPKSSLETEAPRGRQSTFCWVSPVNRPPGVKKKLNKGLTIFLIINTSNTINASKKHNARFNVQQPKMSNETLGEIFVTKELKVHNV